MAITIHTSSATNVRSTTATLWGYWDGWQEDPGYPPRSAGMQYYREGDEGNIVGGRASDNYESPFDHNVAGLWPDKTYYFRATGWNYAGNCPGPPYGGWLSFHTNYVAACSTDPATNIGDTVARLNGHWTKDDETVGVYQFHIYKEGESGNVITYNYSGCDEGEQTFWRDLSSLLPGTIYYFRASVHILNYGRIYGAWRKFHTGTPIVTTKPATNVGNRIATINAEIIIGTDVNKERWFEWKEGETGAVNKEAMGSGGGEFSKNLINLKFGTTYYFRACGKFKPTIPYYYIYGDWLEFTTTALVPTVETLLATIIEATSAVGNGYIWDVGDLEPHCSEIGFEIKYNFSGTLLEYEAWKTHGFDGEITYNSNTGKWEGVLEKEYTEEGTFFVGTFDMPLSDLINDKNFSYRAKAKNSVGWGYGYWLGFGTLILLTRKACVCGVFTIQLCAHVGPIPDGSVIKRRGFRWGRLSTANEYEVWEAGTFPKSAEIGPVDTISFVKSGDDNVYDTIVDSAKGFLDAGFAVGQLISISATGEISPENKKIFIIFSVSGDGGTITVNVRNSLVSESVDGVTIGELFWLFIVDLIPDTIYYSKAFIVIEDAAGKWTVAEGNIVATSTIVNPWEISGADKATFYKLERDQDYKKITRKIEADRIAEDDYIVKAGGIRYLRIVNHLIQTQENAIVIGDGYLDDFKEIKSKMTMEYPTPAPWNREDTIDLGFGRIRFKENEKGVVNFAEDGEGLMLFRYRTIMVIRKINLGQTISKESIDYMATLELEEA